VVLQIAALQSRISKISAEISLLQGAVAQIEQQDRVNGDGRAGDSNRQLLQFNDPKQARYAAAMVLDVVAPCVVCLTFRSFACRTCCSQCHRGVADGKPGQLGGGGSRPHGLVLYPAAHHRREAGEKTGHCLSPHCRHSPHPPCVINWRVRWRERGTKRGS
jgi:hypothetical protein